MEMEQFENLAELSKLNFEGNEQQELMKDLDCLAAMVDDVKNADVDGTFKIQTIDWEDLREDVVVESVGPEMMLKNAPDAKRNSFAVPRIME